MTEISENAYSQWHSNFIVKWPSFMVVLVETVFNDVNIGFVFKPDGRIGRGSHSCDI